MSPESFSERPDTNKADAAEAQKLHDAGLVEKGGVWTVDMELGKGFNGTDIKTVEFRKNGNSWQWRNNSEPKDRWLGRERFPTDGVDAGVKANREKMNKLADDLAVKGDAKQEVDAKDGKFLAEAGVTEQNGIWRTELDLGKDAKGGNITTVEFRKSGNEWQWRNNSEPAGKWLGSQRFPTSGVEGGVKANREKMNKLADDLGVKTDVQKESREKLANIAADYLAKEKVAADSAITPDVEYHVAYIHDSLGYVPFLEHVLEEMKDKDEFFGDGSNEAQLEKNLLQSIAQSVNRNLKELSNALASANPKGGKEYEHLRSIYLERAKRYTELVASVNEEEENVELRNASLAVEQAQQMIPNMNIEEAIDWVQQTLSSIDGNNWQSSGLKETYGKLINACKAGLQKKLAEEKGNIGNDPAKAADFCRHAMELAKLFTDRGSPIDSDLTDIDFAEGMAKDAMGFEELAMRYVEKNLGTRNPLKAYVAEKKGDVLSKLAALPEETRADPQVIEMQKKIEGNPSGIQDISEQYAILRMLETQLNGGGAIDIQQEINGRLSPVLEDAYVKFETFLDGTIGGAATLEEINAAIGEPGLSPMQVEAWKLLADIQGYGYDVSDKTWSYVAMGAKIAAMIAAGIAVGIATGGLGVVAASLAGGAAMTGINAVINQQGFDSIEDAFKTYGKDFAVNTATMGAARYISAGRAAFQLSRAGLLQQAGGLSKVFSIAGKAGGAKLLGSLDDASSLGTRLIGATGEGTADLLIGTSLDTAIKGGQFMENLKGNAMFFGLSFAEFGQQGISGLWRKLRSAPDSQLHGLSQLVNRANLGRMNVHKLTGGVHVEDLLSSADPAALLKQKGIDGKELKQIFDELDELKKTKAEFEAEFKKAAALPDPPDVAAPQSDEEQIEKIKQSIMALPDTPEGLAKRVESGAHILGIEPADISPAQRQAILDAHAVPMADGLKYSPAELKQKMQILEAGGFTRDQADTLLRMGVCGVAAPPPPPFKPKPVDNPNGISEMQSGVLDEQWMRNIADDLASGREDGFKAKKDYMIRLLKDAKRNASPELSKKIDADIARLQSMEFKALRKNPDALQPNNDNPTLNLFKKSAKWNELGDAQKSELEAAIKNHDYDDMASGEEADFIIDLLLQKQRYKSRYASIDEKYDSGARKILDTLSDAEKKILKPDGMSQEDFVDYMRFYHQKEGPEWVTLFHATTDVDGITKGFDPSKLTNEGLGATKGEVQGTFFLTPDYKAAKDYLETYRKMGKGEKAGIVAVRVRRNDPNATAEGHELRMTKPITKDMFDKMGREDQLKNPVNILSIKPVADSPSQAGKKVDFGGKEQEAKVKELIMELPDTIDGLAKRVEAGAFVLGLKQGELTPAQQKAILDAHAVTMADGRKYSPAELKQKMQILEAGGFTREQADSLLRMGVCGKPGEAGLYRSGVPLFAVNMQTNQITLSGTLTGPVAVGERIRIVDASGKEGSTSTVKEIAGPNEKGNMVAVTESGSRYELIPNVMRMLDNVRRPGTKLTLRHLGSDGKNIEGVLTAEIRSGESIAIRSGNETISTSAVKEITGPNNDGHMIVVTESGSRYALVPDETPNNGFVIPKQQDAAPRTPERPAVQRQPFTEGQEVYVVRSNDVAERGWFIRQEPDGAWRIWNPKLQLDKPYDPNIVAHIHEIEEPNVRPGDMPLPKGLEMQRRKFNALKNASLSTDAFRYMFRGELRQDNVGNCYLIAAFNSLKSSPHFEAIIRTSVSANGDGSYTVKLPLGGKDPRREIQVLPKDLENQKDFDRQPGDLRTSLHPVAGGLGWKILEAAYVKSVGGGVLNRKATEGGLSHKALSELFDGSVQTRHIGDWREKLNVRNRDQVINWLDNFNNGKDMGAINSSREVNTDTRTYRVKDANGRNVDIHYKHAYSIESVDKFNQQVTIKNPHDTSKPIVFTYDQLMDTFHDISTASIDFDNFFPSL